MIDIHSHILPFIDDGSSGIQETLQMLESSKKQGVDIIFATPHFSAEKENPEQFLKRRNNSFSKCQFNDMSLPQIQLGAEVAYFNGISQSESIKALCLDNSNLLLLEMPFSPWTNRMVNDVCQLHVRLGIIPVMAHVERYLRQESSSGYIEMLYRNKVMFQCNANFFVSLSTRRKAFSMLRKGMVHFLGSDCHNTDSRPPNLGKSAELIIKKIGVEPLNEINNRANHLLGISSL